MALQDLEINSTKILYDAQMTKAHRTEYNKPCDCQDCRNFYKLTEDNGELAAFLQAFGIDIECAEEVMSFNVEGELIHHEAYYGVFGRIEGEDVKLQRFGVEISFLKGAAVPSFRTGEYFWICIQGDFPYVLEETRERDIALASEDSAPKKWRDRLEKALAMVLISGAVIIGSPFILLYLIFHLFMTPVFYIRHKRSRYQQDFPRKYSWPGYLHPDTEPYTIIKENDLPVEYFKWGDDYELSGYFLYKDILLWFADSFFYDKEKGLLLCWMGEADAEWEEDTDENNTDDCLTVAGTQAHMLQEFRRNVPGRECNRVVFFCQRKQVEKNYEEGGLERMRQLDDFVIYEKGELAKAIREFIEDRR